MTDHAETEGQIFGRHLVGDVPPPELAARYRAAVERLFPDAPDPVDRSLLGFVTRHPWSVGPLDAATALVRPQSRLRAKLLVMAAVLEASPRFAGRFLPEPMGRVALVARLAAVGLAVIGRLVVGAVLYAGIRARA